MQDFGILNENNENDENNEEDNINFSFFDNSQCIIETTIEGDTIYESPNINKSNSQFTTQQKTEASNSPHNDSL